MRLTVLAAAVAAAFLATAAAAQDICTPRVGSFFSVTGVAKNDVLNLRRGASSDQPVVARLKPNETGLRFEGEIAMRSNGCRNACTALAVGVKGARALVELECLYKGNLWFKLKDARGNLGWASARFLKAGGAAPAPQPAPTPPVAQDATYNFMCPGKGRVMLSTRTRTNDAIFWSQTGEEFVLRRERHSQSPIAYVGFADYPAMYLRGTAREVAFSDEYGEVTWCTGMR